MIKSYRNSEKKLSKEQHRLSRKVYNSKNYLKQQRTVAKCHRHVSNVRKDFLHKESRKIANSYDFVCVESLNMRSLSNKGFGNGKATLDNGYGMFVNMLEYKAKWYGRKLIKIDMFYPSTQICSGCGFQNKKLRGMKGLKVREWVCPCCGEVHDRDLNASRNIDREGLKVLNLRDAGVSSLTECQTDEHVLLSDILAREAHHHKGGG